MVDTVAYWLVVGWWLYLQVVAIEASLRSGIEPDEHARSAKVCSEAASLVWSHLAFTLDWHEEVTVVMRGVLRSRKSAPLPSWCMTFGPGLDVGTVWTGRATTPPMLLDAEKLVQPRAPEIWRIEPTRPLDPGESLVVWYRARVVDQTLQEGMRRVTLDEQLVPSFAGLEKPPISPSSVAVARLAAARKSKRQDALGSNRRTDTLAIDIELVHSITAIGAAPGEQVRVWCRNDRRHLVMRWMRSHADVVNRFARRASLYRADVVRAGDIWVQERGLRQCGYGHGR